ncbi:MAG: hypothetical protein HKN27_02160 [Silicimonas sp.]|nr:hypothetical protein [Silicimonas sp.]
MKKMGIFSTKTCDLPSDALLLKYRAQNYTDCFAVQVAGDHDLAAFVAAFYSTWLFKAERFVLAHIAKAPATDAQAVALGRAESDQFSVWRTETRSQAQLLMCPRDETTRSWFMVDAKDRASTTLYFGSALIMRNRPRDAEKLTLKIVIALHRFYSRALLACAAAKLKRTLNP